MRRIAPTFKQSSGGRRHVRDHAPSDYWWSLCGGVMRRPFSTGDVQWDGDAPPMQAPDGICKHCWRRLRKEWREHSAPHTDDN